MPILRRGLLSSRLSFRRRSCQNCNENFHKDGFYGESSTSSSAEQNLKNKGLSNSQTKTIPTRHLLSNIRLRRIS
ncbi:unnamed protein product [Hymenolepis diminuta]|uniref:Uncharacterized protein n=1 Tax=Hymenolepis diminuta TaxID=6216 RepID=A0A564YSP6_HYMDI|nr:unnamed protein product [Hymenolepis diminuta]